MKDKNKTYVVKWQEVVTYRKTVQAESDTDALDIAQSHYGQEDEVHEESHGEWLVVKEVK
tara:strand:+ start:116 stop:295 length:180 start_codon:yes stop_codon:yes gene_type:complete